MLPQVVPTVLEGVRLVPGHQQGGAVEGVKVLRQAAHISHHRTTTLFDNFGFS